MTNTVRTYRVTRGEHLVGYSIRRAGDLVPEAAEWPSLSAYLNVGSIELIYVDKKVLDEFVRKQKIEDTKNAPKPQPPVNTKKRVIRRKVVNHARRDAGTGSAGSSPELSERSV